MNLRFILEGKIDEDEDLLVDAYPRRCYHKRAVLLWRASSLLFMQMHRLEAGFRGRHVYINN